MDDMYELIKFILAKYEGEDLENSHDFNLEIIQFSGGIATQLLHGDYRECLNAFTLLFRATLMKCVCDYELPVSKAQNLVATNFSNHDNYWADRQIEDPADLLQKFLLNGLQQSDDSAYRMLNSMFGLKKSIGINFADMHRVLLGSQLTTRNDALAC